MRTSNIYLAVSILFAASCHSATVSAPLPTSLGASSGVQMAASTSMPSTTTSVEKVAVVQFDASCREQSLSIWSALYTMNVAMDFSGPKKKALRLREQISPSCHDGGWHAVTAAMMREFVLEAKDTEFPNVEATLAAGLKAEPENPYLLSYLVFLQPLGESKLMLPEGSCEAATKYHTSRPALSSEFLQQSEAERVAYVCAAEAMQQGRAMDAAIALEGVDDSLLEDVPLRRAEAYLAAGNKAEAKRVAEKARGQLSRETRSVYQKKLREQAKKLP